MSRARKAWGESRLDLHRAGLHTGAADLPPTPRRTVLRNPTEGALGATLGMAGSGREGHRPNSSIYTRMKSELVSVTPD